MELIMKLFICWAGERSKEIATFLHDWLPKVHQNIKPFMSEIDIGKGEQWTKVLSEQLEDSHFGLVCLTSDNLAAPWLHFEAGALSKITESHVVPILYKLEAGDIKGPLKDFQAAAPFDNKVEMQRVLEQIDVVMGDPGNKNWRGTFNGLWSMVGEKIKNLDDLDKIEITSPKDGGVLVEQIKHRNDEAFTYLVRGTLKHLQKDHHIWLLNSNKEGQVWPQAPVTTRDEVSGKWEGRVYLQTKYNGTFINAVVAPPTSQQLFEYYHLHGKTARSWIPLSTMPPECQNVARVWASNPNYSSE
jgi:hypothetical protein